AEELARQAQQVEQQANARPVLTPGELAELDRLRRAETTWKRTEADLQQQINALKAPPPAADPRSAAPEMPSRDPDEFDRFGKAESARQRAKGQLAQGIKGGN